MSLNGKSVNVHGRVREAKAKRSSMHHFFFIYTRVVIHHHHPLPSSRVLILSGHRAYYRSHRTHNLFGQVIEPALLEDIALSLPLSSLQPSTWTVVFGSFLLIVYIQKQYLIADIGILAKYFSGKRVFLSSAAGEGGG